MVGQPDKTDLSLFTSLEHRLIEPASVSRLWTEGRIVELINIDIVRPQQPQACLQILPELIRIRRRRLGRYVQMAALP